MHQLALYHLIYKIHPKSKFMVCLSVGAWYFPTKTVKFKKNTNFFAKTIIKKNGVI